MHVRDFSFSKAALRGAIATALIAVMAPLALAQALDTPTLSKTSGGFFRM